MEKIPFTLYDFFGYLAAGTIVLASADYAFDGGADIRSSLSVAQAAVWVVLAYVAGHAVANIARTVLERWLVERAIGRIPTENLMGKEPCGRLSQLIFRDYFRPLPDAIRERVAERVIEQRLPEIARDRSADSRDAARALRIHCQYVAMRDGGGPDERFPALRDFARNTSVACAIAAVLIVVARAAHSHPAPSWGWVVAAGAASIALFYRFLRFHRFYEADLLNRFAASSLAESPSGQQLDSAVP